MALKEEFEKQGIWLFRYRSTLPLIALLIGTIFYLRTEIYPETFILEDTSYEKYYELFSIFISLFGLFIRVYTVGYTPENTSGRNVKAQVADKLNTTGMYSIVRHPLYLGNFFMWLGPALMTANIWFIFTFCLVYWLYYERIMFAEEQFLRNKFQQVYLDWANNIPAFFPNFKNFEKSNLPFSWKKVLKKEKNGLVAIFLIFTLFNICGEAVEKKPDYNLILIGLCVFSIIAYLILRYMKKHTCILDEKGR